VNAEACRWSPARTDGFTHTRMNQLDLCGVSGLAPFYLAVSRGLDILLALPYADPQRVAVSGLSGGGWQTIIISSLDPRVTIAAPVAGYSSFVTRAQFPEPDLGDSGLSYQLGYSMDTNAPKIFATTDVYKESASGG